MNALQRIHRRSRLRRAPAFVFIDIAFGLGLLGLIAVALVTTVGRQNRAAHKLSETRAAVRLADDALMSLRAGRTVAPDGVSVTRLPDPAPQGYTWARASARIGTADAQVVGLVPDTAVAAPAREGRTP